MAIRFFRLFSPEIICIDDFGILSRFATRAINSVFALPSTGGAEIEILIVPFSIMVIFFFEDLGETVMSSTVVNSMIILLQCIVNKASFFCNYN